MKIAFYTGGMGDIDWLMSLYKYVDIFSAEPIMITASENVASNITNYFSRIYVFDVELFNPIRLYNPIKTFWSAEKPDIIITPCSIKGRIIGALFAGISNTNIFTDVIEFEKCSNESYIIRRLVYGGLAIADIKTTLPFIICHLSRKEKYTSSPSLKGEIIRLRTGESRVSVEFKPKRLEGISPKEADIVLVGGRGFKERKDLDMIIKLANYLNGAWSVTRPLAADYKWADEWIGMSGLIINPKIYIGIGVSGQPHHMMGVRDSKTIIAINKDPEAPIFEECDYGIVADLYQILPILIKKIENMKR